MDTAPLSANARPGVPVPSRDAQLLDSARKLEAGFLAEMLTAAGAGKPREALGGDTGEDQFSSILVTAQAEAMVAAGGIGLADRLYTAMKGRADAK